MKKYILDPKRDYVRTEDGEINPSQEELGMNDEEYDKLCMSNSQYIAQVALFNQAYRQKIVDRAVRKQERSRLKLIGHWYKTVDKIYLHEVILRNIGKVEGIAAELADSCGNSHFRGYYMESIERLKPHNLKIPMSLPDSKLIGFPNFDGTNIHGTPTQMFKMYMAFFPPLPATTSTGGVYIYNHIRPI